MQCDGVSPQMQGNFCGLLCAYNTQHVFHLETPHCHFFSARKKNACVQAVNTSQIRQGAEGAPGRSVAGFGHTAELLRLRFHMLCRLQLPEDLEIKQPKQLHNKRGLNFTLCYTLQPDHAKQCITLMSSWALLPPRQPS